MKKFLLVCTFAFLTINPAFAQKISKEEICNCSSSCKKVCKMTGINNEEDKKLVLQCSEDITKKYKLDQLE